MFTPHLSIGLIIAVIVVFRLLLVIKKAYLTPLRHIPGPFHAKFTNWGLKLRVIKGERAQYIHSLHQRYGQYVRITPDEVAISNLDAFRSIHRIGSEFNKSPWYAKFVSDQKSPGIFAMTDPKVHAARRRLFAQQFSNSAILGYDQMVRQHAERAVSKIHRDALAGNADVLKWWTFMATDLSASLSFGKSIGMLDSEAKGQYIEDLEKAMIISGVRVELPYVMAIAQYLPIKTAQEALNLPKRMQLYGETAIANHRDALADNPGMKSLFSKFLDPSKHQTTISEAQVVDEASNLIVAGSDTTAITLTYMTWAILKPEHSMILRRLLEEISAVSIEAPTSQIAALPYLKQVIDESLRLYGAAPGSLPRIVPQGGTRLGAYHLPAGTTVCTQAYTLHRDSSIFQDPEQ